MSVRSLPITRTIFADILGEARKQRARARDIHSLRRKASTMDEMAAEMERERKRRTPPGRG